MLLQACALDITVGVQKYAQHISYKATVHVAAISLQAAVTQCPSTPITVRYFWTETWWGRRTQPSLLRRGVRLFDTLPVVSGSDVGRKRIDTESGLRTATRHKRALQRHTGTWNESLTFPPESSRSTEWKRFERLDVTLLLESGETHQFRQFCSFVLMT